MQRCQQCLGLMEIKTIRHQVSGVNMGTVLSPCVPFYYPSLHGFSSLPSLAGLPFSPDPPLWLTLVHFPITSTCTWPWQAPHQTFMSKTHSTWPICSVFLQILESESDWWAVDQEVVSGPIRSRERWGLLRHHEDQGF